MKSYIALIRLDLRLALRQKSVLFFNYMFPLIFFITFAQIMHGNRGGAVTQIISMGVILGAARDRLFGAGMRGMDANEAKKLPPHQEKANPTPPPLVGYDIVGMGLVL